MKGRMYWGTDIEKKYLFDFISIQLTVDLESGDCFFLFKTLPLNISYYWNGIYHGYSGYFIRIKIPIWMEAIL